jgi:CHAT domain-containing protein
MLRGITILATIVGMTWMALLAGASIAIGSVWYVTSLLCLGTLFLMVLLYSEVFRGERHE